MFNVPLTTRSFRDGTPIYCPLRRTWSSINTPFRPGIEPRVVAWQSITLPLSHASSNEFRRGMHLYLIELLFGKAIVFNTVHLIKFFWNIKDKVSNSLSGLRRNYGICSWFEFDNALLLNRTEKKIIESTSE